MRYVAAYLLAALGGNNSPSADDMKKIIGSVGIDCEADKIKKVMDELKGKNIEELITKGNLPKQDAVFTLGWGNLG